MKRQHFTMTELLVVMAIIMILAGLVFPAIGGAKNRARTAACLSNQKQVITGIIMSMNANKNRFYSPKYIGADNGVNDTKVRWTARLRNRKYLADYSVMRCSVVQYPPVDWQGFRAASTDTAERNDDVFTFGAVHHAETETKGFDFRGTKFLRDSDKKDIAPTKLMLGACSWNTKSKSGGALLNTEAATTGEKAESTIAMPHGGEVNMFFLDGRSGAYSADDLAANKLYYPSFSDGYAKELDATKNTIMQ